MQAIQKIKDGNLPLVCLSGKQSGPFDFNYLVIDGDNKMRAKFIDIEDAKKYADSLTNHEIK